MLRVVLLRVVEPRWVLPAYPRYRVRLPELPLVTALGSLSGGPLPETLALGFLVQTLSAFSTSVFSFVKAILTNP